MADATIIMAGGVGARLWPASLSATPKQLLRIGGGESLIQQAVRRGLAVTSDGPVIIVTHKDHVESIAAHINEMDGDSSAAAPSSVTPPSSRVVYLPEPLARNTAPAIALGMRYVEQELGEDATVMVLTADHVIHPLDAFAADAQRADLIARSGRLACLGVLPTRPETGYGYIEVGEELVVGPDRRAATDESGKLSSPGREVVAFKEKPDAQTAESYISRGNFYWNSGMFCFLTSHFWDELSSHAPDLARAFRTSSYQIKTAAFPDGSVRAEALDFADLYDGLPKISIDYALLEKSASVAAVLATFSWNDVGSWDEISAFPDAATGTQTVIEVDASGNYVDSELPVAICGVSDIHVIVRHGKVLVCKRGKSQLVKQVVDSAREAGREDLV